MSLSSETASRSDSSRYDLQIKFQVTSSSNFCCSKKKEPSVDDIMSTYNFYFDAIKEDELSSKPSYGKGPISLIPVCLALARDPDGSSSIGYNQIFPTDISIQDSLQVLAPQADQEVVSPTVYPFDSSLLSYLTVRVCENSTNICDTDALSVADGSVIVINERNVSSTLPWDTADYLELKVTSSGSKTEMYAGYWDIENYPMLGGKDLRFDFYVGDLFVGSTLFPVAEEEDNVQSPVEFAITSNPVIRAHVLRGRGFSANTIATHLMCEFYATPEVVIGLLLEEGFSAVEVARAVKFNYATTADDYALYGVVTGTNSIIVATGVKDECSFNVTDYRIAGKYLYDAGYDCEDNYVAMRDVYNVSPSDNEDLQYSLGYSEESITRAILPDLLIKYHGFISRYGPRIIYHPNELYKMSNIDWYLSQTDTSVNNRQMKMHYKKADSDDVFVHTTPLSRENLFDIEKEVKDIGATKVWMQYEGMKGVDTPDGNSPRFDGDFFISPGAPQSAKAYVKSVRIRQKGVVDLTFWLWYPYNGPGTTKVEAKVTGNALLIPPVTNIETGGNPGNTDPLGDHPTDWELVVVRVNEIDGNLISVTTSGEQKDWGPCNFVLHTLTPAPPFPLLGHGAFSRYDYSELNFVPGTNIPKVYTALNGHALFSGNEIGDNYHTETEIDETVVDEGPFKLRIEATLGSANFCFEKPILTPGVDFLESSASYELFAVDNVYVDTDGNVDDKSWAAFGGLWGSDTDYGDYSRTDLVDNIIDGGNVYGRILGTLTASCAAYVAIAYLIPFVGIVAGPVALAAWAAAFAIISFSFVVVDVFGTAFAIEGLTFLDDSISFLDLKSDDIDVDEI